MQIHGYFLDNHNDNEYSPMESIKCEEDPPPANERQKKRKSSKWGFEEKQDVWDEMKNYGIDRISLRKSFIEES